MVGKRTTIYCLPLCAELINSESSRPDLFEAISRSKYFLPGRAEFVTCTCRRSAIRISRTRFAFEALEKGYIATRGTRLTQNPELGAIRLKAISVASSSWIDTAVAKNRLQVNADIAIYQAAHLTIPMFS